MSNITMFGPTMFDVAENPIKVEGLRNSADYKFIVRCDTSEVLSCMSSEYRLVTNEEVMKHVMPIMKTHKAKLTEARSFSNGRRSNWTFTFPDKVEIAEGDFVNPTVNIGNSYDGTTAVNVIAGAYRLICANGMKIGKIFGKINNRHSVYNPNLDKLDEIIPQIVEASKVIAENDMQELVDTPVFQGHIANALELLPEQYMEEALNYTLKSKPKTYWDLLNMLTWVSTHIMDREKEATHQFESTIWPEMKKMASNAPTIIAEA